METCGSPQIFGVCTFAERERHRGGTIYTAGADIDGGPSTKARQRTSNGDGDCTNEPPAKKQKVGLTGIFDKLKEADGLPGSGETQGALPLNERIWAELQKYSASPSIDADADALKWWDTNGPMFPELSKLAKKYLAVPATRGSNLNTEYPGLSCSHDGWVKINGRVKKVLEIKCPFSPQDVDPHYFDFYLKGKRLNSFYLKRNVKGEITLKENTIYYDQVQMELALTGVSTCDFVVWSKKGLLTIPISFNQSAWDNLHPELKKIPLGIYGSRIFLKAKCT
ncbi:hypothetical protein FOCC_FOCC013251 [Frankliniella occidentalis]|nr:hypothetical protein FOCC_FOCC013251 [Frankliniella occidentalis]